MKMSFGLNRLLKGEDIDSYTCTHVKNGAIPYYVMRLEKRILKQNEVCSIQHTSNNYKLIGYKEIKLCLECACAYG